MPTKSTTACDVAASSDEGFQPPKSSLVGNGIHSEFSLGLSSSTSGKTQATFHFSYGNPRIDESRGFVHLFVDEVPSPSSTSSYTLPVERKPLVFVVGVPNHMTYADFCQFCGSFIHDILDMRVVRDDETEDTYGIFISFSSQVSTDNFYKHLNQRRYSSLETEVCRMHFVVDIQYIASMERVQALISTDQITCPVCLDRLDQGTSGILTTICNHSFHCSCISKWTDSSCPVCRYCQQEPEKSVCFVCQTSENLWICVICGFVGCGKNKGGHAIAHWKDTQHCYSLELETQRVWDYAGDNYVHRLIQSKTDGELVELNSHCAHANDGCMGCARDATTNEALLNSRVELIVNEYNELLTSQLENQKLYFESLLREVKEETEMEISRAIEKVISQKLQKMQAKLDKRTKEKKFLDDLNENLLKNKEIWETKILEMEEREKRTLEAKDKKIQDLDRQLRDLMAILEAGQLLEESSKNNAEGGSNSTSSTEPSSNNGVPRPPSSSTEPSSKNNAKRGSKPKNKKRR